MDKNIEAFISWAGNKAQDCIFWDICLWVECLASEGASLTLLHKSQSMSETLRQPNELVAHKTPKKHHFFSQNNMAIPTDHLTFSRSPVPPLHIVNIFLHFPKPALAAGKCTEAPNLLLTSVLFPSNILSNKEENEKPDLSLLC